MNTPKPQIKLIEQSAAAEFALNTFLSLSLDLFCIRGLDGYFKQLNPAWEKVLGWTEAELRSQPWIEFVHPEDVAASLSGTPQCNKEYIVEYENRYRHKNGSYRWLSWRVARHQDGLIYEVAKDITAAKQSEKAVRERLEFEKLITTLSTEFINLSSEEIEEGINDALQAIGEFSGFDRTYIVLFSEDGTEAGVVYQWCAASVEPLADKWRRFSTEPYPWLMAKLRDGEAIQVPTLAALPSEANNTRLGMHLSHTQSILAVPMVQSKSVMGYVAFAAVKEEKILSDDNVALLRIIGQLFANAISRKQAEEALRESEQRWQLALRGNNDSIWDLNLKTNQCFHSVRWAQILGYEADEVSNHWDNWETRVHRDDLERVIQIRQEHLERQTPYYIAEYRIRCKDGSYKWILSRAQALWDEAGNPVRMVGSHTDISDRKRTEAALQRALSELETKVEERTADLKQANDRLQAEITEHQRTEAALRQSEELFRRVFEEAPIGMVLRRVDGRFFRVNRAFTRMLGYTESELLALTYADITHPEDLEREIPYIEQVINEELDGYQLEKRYLNKHQEILQVKMTTVVMRDETGEILYALAMVEDITERKQAEEALRLSEEQFRRVFDDSPIGMSLEELDYGFIRVNRALCEMLGYTESELMAFKCCDVIHPEDWERELPYEKQLRTGEIDSYQLEERLIKKNQEIVWVNLTVVLLRNEAGEALYILGMAEDITQRKQAQKALQQSEELLRSIIEDQTELICRFKPDGTLTFVNNAYCRYFSKHSSELIGHSFMPTISEEDQEFVTQNFSFLCQNQPIVTYEHRIVLPSGEIRWQQWTNRAFFDEQGHLIEFQAVGRDITQLKQAEAEIRKALEKERELSELRSDFVSLVSHEFRTPLTTIQSSAELLDRYNHRLSDEQKQNHLRRILGAVSRMTQLLEDVLTIGKAEAGKLSFEPVPIDLVAFCRNIADSLQISASSRHAINFVAQGNCSNAHMDKKLLEHIVTNLLSNAIKYSPQGGTVQFNLVCTSDSAVFRIQDTGIGIPQDYLEQMFETFQRARNVGSIPGTGLGLAIVKKCVDLHGGQIAIESEVGVGTTFTVTLPLN